MSNALRKHRRRKGRKHPYPPVDKFARTVRESHERNVEWTKEERTVGDIYAACGWGVVGTNP